MGSPLRPTQRAVLAGFHAEPAGRRKATLLLVAACVSLATVLLVCLLVMLTWYAARSATAHEVLTLRAAEDSLARVMQEVCR